MDLISRRRAQIYQLYESQLRSLAERGVVRLPTVPLGCESNHHMFYILVNSLSERTKLIEHPKAHGILAVFHYIPLHPSPMGEAMGYREGMFPVTERLSERLLRLPMYYEMQDSEVMSVVTEIFNFFKIALRSAAA